MKASACGGHPSHGWKDPCLVLESEKDMPLMNMLKQGLGEESGFPEVPCLYIDIDIDRDTSNVLPDIARVMYGIVW